MGKKNIVFNDYISQNERFADFYNGIMFHGRQIIHPEALTALDTKLWRRNEGKDSYHEYIRDQVKLWEYQGRKFILGLEPEESLHFALPVKYMNYESIQHDRNYKKIMKRHRIRKDLGSEEYLSGFTSSDQLIPVITVGVYLGGQSQKIPTHLNQMAAVETLPETIKDDIRAFCNDFRANLLVVNKLETSDMFVTDLREVFGFLKRQNNHEALKKYVLENEGFRHLKEDAYDVVAAYSNNRELEIKKKEYQTKGGFDMCLAMQKWAEEERTEGRSEGKTEGRAEGIQAMNTLICRLMEDGRTDELFRSSQDMGLQKKLMEEYGIQAILS